MNRISTDASLIANVVRQYSKIDKVTSKKSSLSFSNCAGMEDGVKTAHKTSKLVNELLAATKQKANSLEELALKRQAEDSNDRGKFRS